MTARDGKWAKTLRDLPPPPRWLPFYTKGRTHRGPYRLDAAGWYFLTGKDELRGPYPNKMLCRRASGAAEMER